MLEIKGSVSTAKCFAETIEDEAIDQIRRLCDQEFTKGSSIRIMPDVHWGKGSTIGTTMTVTDGVVPNVVGVDIGCGMYTVNLGKEEPDLERLDEAAHYIPSGREVWAGRQEKFDLTGLNCARELQDSKKLVRSLGSLGGGNHFIEVDKAQDGTHYLVIHTGSRNLGKQIAEYYQNLAVDLHQGKEDYIHARENMIAEYKAAGRRSELHEALKSLKWEKKELTIPEDLCYLYGEFLEKYMEDVAICQRFAHRNREIIAEVIMDRAGLKGTDAFHTVHNYVDTENRIVRKGAISARQGERVLIPINMRDGSILGVGKGNPDWNYSAPHGAGRVLSRLDAKAKLSLDEFRESMEGVYTTSVAESTLDEAPMAYKSLDEIVGTLDDAVEIVEIIRPVYNFKFHGWQGPAKHKTS